MNWIELTRNEKYIMGVDEVGRGPLFGGVVSAAVLMPKNIYLVGINDSKKLSAKKRELFYKEIFHSALAIGFGYVDEKIIDEINILEATKLAMIDAINNASKIQKPDLILVDSVKLDGFSDLCSFNHGDELSYNIASASIIAKQARDALCYGWEKMFPGYDILSNKGYGTKKHYLGIDEHGITPLHRRSFLKKYEAAKQSSR